MSSKKPSQRYKRAVKGVKHPFYSNLKNGEEVIKIRNHSLSKVTPTKLSPSKGTLGSEEKSKRSGSTSPIP